MRLVLFSSCLLMGCVLNAQTNPLYKVGDERMMIRDNNEEFGKIVSAPYLEDEWIYKVNLYDPNTWVRSWEGYLKETDILNKEWSETHTLPTPTPTPTPTVTPPTPAAQPFAGGVLNVEHFGAIGDGLTDDTAAIQAVVDQAISTDSVIYGPPGVYLISAPIRIWGPVVWHSYGGSRHPTFIISKQGNFPGVIITGRHSVIEGIAVSGTSSPQQDSDAHGWHIRGKGTYEIASYANGGHGIALEAQANDNLNGTELTAYSYDNDGDGLHIVDSADPSNPDTNAIMYHRVEVGRNKGNGISIINAISNTGTFLSQGNQGHGLFIGRDPIAGGENSGHDFVVHSESNGMVDVMFGEASDITIRLNGRARWNFGLDSANVRIIRRLGGHAYEVLR